MEKKKGQMTQPRRLGKLERLRCSNKTDTNGDMRQTKGVILGKQSKEVL